MANKMIEKLEPTDKAAEDLTVTLRIANGTVTQIDLLRRMPGQDNEIAHWHADEIPSGVQELGGKLADQLLVPASVKLGYAAEG